MSQTNRGPRTPSPREKENIGGDKRSAPSRAASRNSTDDITLLYIRDALRHIHRAIVTWT